MRKNRGKFEVKIPENHKFGKMVSIEKIDLTQSYHKSHHSHRKLQKITTQENATETFHSSKIADWLRTVSWSNDSHPTGLRDPNLPTNIKSYVIKRRPIKMWKIFMIKTEYQQPTKVERHFRASASLKKEFGPLVHQHWYSPSSWNIKWGNTILYNRISFTIWTSLTIVYR